MWAAAFSCVVGFSIWLSDGNLIYTLDDPYIHLSVAENIIRGNYGVNLTDYASPSSSILYPLLLSLTEFIHLGSIGPLIINTVATGFATWLLLEFFWRCAMAQSATTRDIFPNAIAPFLILSINGLALAMTGMEHSLHVLIVIITIRGLITILEKGYREPIPFWFGLAIITGPLIRFEGLALAGSSILALIIIGRWQAAVTIGLILSLCLGTYGYVMHTLGLPLLPSSVMVKSNVFTTDTIESGISTKLFALISNIQASLTHRWGIIFILAVCTLALTGIFNYKTRLHATTTKRPNLFVSPGFLVGGIMTLSLVAHLVAGRYGWFHRYEVYAVSIMVICSIYLLRAPIQKITKARYYKSKLGILCGLLLLIFPYFGASLLTPIASRGIYDQQFQMHRFATQFFPHAVAVNDLGWTSYQNDSYVLDLWGLGSEEVRKLRSFGQFDQGTIEKVVENAHVDYAMIYKSWFKQGIPESWCLLAILKTETVTAASSSVYFYATNQSATEKMTAALSLFAPTLPKRNILERSSCPT